MVASHNSLDCFCASYYDYLVNSRKKKKAVKVYQAEFNHDSYF